MLNTQFRTNSIQLTYARCYTHVNLVRYMPYTFCWRTRYAETHFSCIRDMQRHTCVVRGMPLHVFMVYVWCITQTCIRNLVTSEYLSVYVYPPSQWQPIVYNSSYSYALTASFSLNSAYAKSTVNETAKANSVNISLITFLRIAFQGFFIFFIFNLGMWCKCELMLEVSRKLIFVNVLLTRKNMWSHLCYIQSQHH